MTTGSKTKMHQLGHALIHTPGDTKPELRKKIIDYVVAITLDQVNHSTRPDPGIIPLVDKINFAAYSIEDEDLAVLRQGGLSDDALYEIILSAAYGAGLARLQTLQFLFNEINGHET